MLLIISVKLYYLFPFLCEHFSDDSRYYTTSGMSLVITAPTSTATLSPTVSLPIIFAPQNKTTLSPTVFVHSPRILPSYCRALIKGAVPPDSHSRIVYYFRYYYTSDSRIPSSLFALCS